MQTNTQVSILVSDLETHESLPRMLQSIARQSEGLDRTEIIIVGNGGHASSSESIWSAITGLDTVSLLNVDKDASLAQARNAAAASANGDFFIFMRPDDRLDPKYLTTAFSVFSDYPDADVMYADYTRLAAKQTNTRPGMIQLADFDHTVLQTRNTLGPAVMMRRAAFEQTEGFRDTTVYRDWDMWVQLANWDTGFYHVNYPLASCEHTKVSFRERAEDGRYKAMIVINNPAFFHEHTLRWALAYLRGESWAQAFSFMVIPSAMEVTRMLHDHNMKLMGTDTLAQEVIRQFDSSPHTIEATR